MTQSLEFSWGERFLVAEWVDSMNPDVIIMESFRLYAHEAQNLIGSDFPSCQVIGMVEARLFEMHKLGKLVYQPAYNTKGVIVLPEHTSKVGGSEHRKDAYKHLRYYVAKNHVVKKTRRPAAPLSRWFKKSK